jgi:FkbM family methyltransferase
VKIKAVNIKFREINFTVNEQNELYGEEFWNRVAKRNYEPDVLDLITRYVDSDTIFFDIGAGTGVYSLISASLGSTVVAYEPIFKYFRELEVNINLNINLREKIISKKAIVSIFNDQANLSESAGKLISPIVYNQKLDQSSEPTDYVSIVDLKSEVKKFVNKENFVIKLDIEGGEYKLLHDVDLLKILKLRNAKVILAIHPGFFRPVTSVLVFKYLSKLNFMIRNYFDNYFLYLKLSKFSTCFRTNEVKVNSPHKFALISAAGVYEYLLVFSDKS